MTLRKWVASCFIVLVLTTIILPSAFAASELSEAPAYTLSISNDTPSKGERVEVLVKGSHLKDVYAFEINLDFDPLKLKLVDAKTDIPGFSVGPIQKDNHIQLAHTRVGQVKGIDGEQILFKIHFEAIQYGKAELLLSRVKIVDSALVSAALQIDAQHSLTIQSPYRFDDMDDFKWAIQAIEALAKDGIIQGTAERIFSPADSITRADFVVLLMRALKLKGAAGQIFHDVESGMYYTEALAEARELNIVQGDENNNFLPKASITREDMMVLTDRALHAVNKRSTNVSLSALDAFNDTAAISDYAAGSVASLVQLGLVQGYGNGIHPKETTNRAQAAMLIHSLVVYAASNP